MFGFTLRQNINKKESYIQPGGWITWDINVSMNLENHKLQDIKQLTLIKKISKYEICSSEISEFYDADSEVLKYQTDIFQSVSVCFKTYIKRGNFFSGKVLPSLVQLILHFKDGTIRVIKDSREVNIGYPRETLGRKFLAPFKLNDFKPKITSDDRGNNSIIFSHPIISKWSQDVDYYEDFIVRYQFNEKMRLKYIVFPGSDEPNHGWFFARNFSELQNQIPLKKYPNYNVKIDLYDSSQYIFIRDPIQGGKYTPTELLINKNDTIKSIEYHFDKGIESGACLSNEALALYCFHLENTKKTDTHLKRNVLTVIKQHT